MRFNIASLDKRKLIQSLYTFASPKMASPRDEQDFKRSGNPVENLSLKDCSSIVYNRYNTACAVNYIRGKPPQVRWKRISDTLIVLDSCSYDLLHGRYRMLEAMLAAFDIRAVKIVDRGYDGVVNAALQKMERRMCEDVFSRLLERSVLTTDDDDNPHWTLLTPLHELAARFDIPGCFDDEAEEVVINGKRVEVD